MDHRSLRAQAERDHASKISNIRGESPSDEAADKKMIKRAFGEHDTQLHGGKRTKLELRDGGHCEGGRSAPRMDRPGRARGGKMGKGKKGGSTVNVIVASGKGEDRPVPVPVPAAGGAPPPRPPMPPPGAMGPGGPPMGGPPGMGGGPPPGMMGGRPPMMPPGMMRADGGGVDASKPHGKDVAFRMKAGAGSGMGRLAKAKMPIPDEAAAGD